jgi:hypothetical protein
MFTSPDLTFYFTISIHVFYNLYTRLPSSAKRTPQVEQIVDVCLWLSSLIMNYYLEILLISWGDEKYSLRFYF